MTLQNGQQIVKTRDDHAPVLLHRPDEPTDPQKPFQIAAGSACSWAKADESFGPEKLRSRIEPLDRTGSLRKRPYFPMQKLAKIFPSKSSLLNSPVISASAFWTCSSSSANSSPA